MATCFLLRVRVPVLSLQLMLLRRAIATVLPGAASRAAACGASPHRSVTLLAALVERSPQITPAPTEAEQVQEAHQLALEAKHKVYPTVLTAAEEGPDQQRARLRMESIVETEGSREGEGDRTGDMRSLDRRLAQRLYLLVYEDGRWQFPQQEWQAPESARGGLRRVIAASCGDGLETHQMGNAPIGHLPLLSGDTLFLWRHLYVSGDVSVPEGLDYAWLTRDELVELVDEDLGELSAVACGPFA